jgi:hypothetical protein
MTKQDGPVRYWKTTGREERGGKKLKRKVYGNMEDSEKLSSSDSFKMAMMLVEVVELEEKVHAIPSSFFKIQ